MPGVRQGRFGSRPGNWMILRRRRRRRRRQLEQDMAPATRGELVAALPQVGFAAAGRGAATPAARARSAACSPGVGRLSRDLMGGGNGQDVSGTGATTSRGGGAAGQVTCLKGQGYVLFERGLVVGEAARGRQSLVDQALARLTSAPSQASSPHIQTPNETQLTNSHQHQSTLINSNQSTRCIHTKILLSLATLSSSPLASSFFRLRLFQAPVFPLVLWRQLARP